LGAEGPKRVSSEQEVDEFPPSKSVHILGMHQFTTLGERSREGISPRGRKVGLSRSERRSVIFLGGGGARTKTVATSASQDSIKLNFSFSTERKEGGKGSQRGEGDKIKQ